MKIKKKFLEKIIKEEIRSFLYDEKKEDELKTKIIHVYSAAVDRAKDITSEKDIAKLIFDLNSIGIHPAEAFQQLTMKDVAMNFYINAAHLHNEIVKRLGNGKRIDISAFQHFPKIIHNTEKNQDDVGMRVPKTQSAYNQLDTRKDRKNLVMGS